MFLDKFLKPILDRFTGQKTYLAGIGLLGLALYQATEGQATQAVQSALAGLAALGLRHAIETPQAQQPQPEGGEKQP